MTDHSILGAAAPTGHPLFQLAERLASRVVQKRRRKGFNDMLALDDHMLNDIGVQRDEIEYVRRLPLSVDAATELRWISLERRRRRF